MNDDDKKILISGPHNAVRLEGKVLGQKCILYVFMDVHLPLQGQTNCGSYKLYTFNEYLMDNFKSDNKLNYFLEFYSNFKPNNIDLWRKHNNIYLDQARLFFNDNYVYDPKENKVEPSAKYPNVKFHYIDFRPLNPKQNLDLSDALINKIRREISPHFHKNDIDDLLYYTSQIYKYALEEYTFIFKDVNNYTYNKKLPRVNNFFEFNKLDPETKLNFYRNYIYKTLKIYKNKEIQNIIDKFVQDELKKRYEQLLTISTDLFEYLDKVFKDMKPPNFEEYNNDDGKIYIAGLTFDERADIISTIEKKARELEELLIICNVMLMDTYFLRRLLDKQYPGTNIVYTGGYHSVNYINFLVKYLDFDITHFSHMKYDKNKITSLLKKKFDTFTSGAYFFRPNEWQCSDMTSFPKNFS